MEKYATDKKVFFDAFAKLLALICSAHVQWGASKVDNIHQRPGPERNGPDPNKDFRFLAIQGSRERMKIHLDEELLRASDFGHTHVVVRRQRHYE